MTTDDVQVIQIPPAFGDFGEYKRYRFFYGGRGGAKSWTIARVIICLAATQKLRILCCREFQNSIADSAKKLIADQIEAMGLPAFFKIQESSITSTAGSEILFKGMARNEQSIKSTEGIDICWVEEAQTISETSIELLIPTIRKSGSQLWFSFNPENDFDPIYKYMESLRSDPDALICKINWSDNPWFPKELEGERTRMLNTDPELYYHIWEGECRTISDALIFKDKFSVEEFETPATARFFHGADWGFSVDPTALVRCYMQDECLYIDREEYATGVELDEMKEFFNRIPTVKNWPIKADGSRPETISFMDRQGFNISAAQKWPGSVEDGITYLRGFKKIIIHPRCKNTAEEFRRYSYKVDRKNKDILPVPLDAFNHCIAEGQLITTSRGDIPVETVRVGDFVMTRDGYRRVYSSGLTRQNAEVWEVVVGGRRLLATPDHEVYTSNRGFTRVDALRYGDTLIIGDWECRKQPEDPRYASSRSMVDINGTDTRMHLHGTIGSISVGGVVSENDGLGCIDRCGRIRMERSHKGHTYTTLTTILSITTHLISSAVATTRSIWGCILGQKSVKPDNASISSVSEGKHLNGMVAQRVANSMSASGNSPGKTDRCEQSHASSVEQTSKREMPSKPHDFVLVNARLESFGVVTHKNVYDISVEGTPEFFASGILVHNCVDAIRYALDGYIRSDDPTALFERLS